MNHSVILASASPRRKELLSLIIDDFEVIVSDAEEVLRENCDIQQEILRFAKEKAVDVLRKTQGNCCVIGSDTMVILEGRPMGKPKDKEQAYEMLKALSGNTHEVMTAVCVVCSDGLEANEIIKTQVTFNDMTHEEIEGYIATGEPMDKAGAYGIQGKGAPFIKGIEGDYYSVMGLPVSTLYGMLKELGIKGNV